MTLTLDYVKAKSANRLSGLHPVVRQATERLIERSFACGVPILITQGLRTIAEQDALYAQGRSKPGNIVTNARGGYSNHNFGVAIDFALLMPDGRSVSWDTLRDGDKDSLPDWSEVVDIAKSLGFEWGGDWRSFKDMPHFEMCFGLTTSQYRAGQKPSEIAIAKVLATINKEDEDKLELSNYQWQSLRNGVSELIASKKITDKTWLDKIDKRTLTVSELSWLTFTVALR